MPAKSKAQQRLFALVHAAQTGKKTINQIPKEFRKTVETIVNTISKKKAKEFAETKHKKLPEKIKESINTKTSLIDFMALKPYLEDIMKLEELLAEQEMPSKRAEKELENIKKTIENSQKHELEAMALSPKRPMEHRLMALKKLKGKDVTEKDLDDLLANVRERFKKNKREV